jgi:hypothetical protein
VGIAEDLAKRVLHDELHRRDLAVQQGYDTLTERIAELELALEDSGWLRLGDESLDEFSRDGLRRITRLARLFYLSNPLVQRGVNIQKYYVWGQSVEIKGTDKRISDVIKGFMDDPKNAVELTSHQARMMKEGELQTDGNLFFVFFTNKATGRVRVRSIPFAQIDDIIFNPDDGKEPWYYKRSWTESVFNTTTGSIITGPKTAYYPDWRYMPKGIKSAKIADKPVMWDSPVYHVKTGGFGDWKFGVSEVYAAIDWARAYKEFLEDWASIVRSYRRFAWVYSGAKSKGEIAAVTSKMDTTYASGGGVTDETQPPPVTGAFASLLEGRGLQPVRTAGATVAAEDGRRLLLMVAATFGLPETFFGDVSVGTLATAKSLDRPTELRMRDRQTLWGDIHMEILNYVLLQAVKAPGGLLNGLGRVVAEVYDGKIEERVEWNEDVDPYIDVDFPPMVEADADKVVDSIVSAATLKGLPPAGTIPKPEISRMVLSALGEEDIDEILEELYPEGWEEEEPTEWEEESLADVMKDVKERFERAIEKYAD